MWFGIFSGDATAVREHLTEQLPLCAEHAFPHLMITAQIAQGWVRAVGAYTADGLAQIAQACAAIDGMKAQISLPFYRATLVEAASRLGQWATAREALTAAPHAHNRIRCSWYAPELQRWQGELLLTQEVKNQKPVLSRGEGTKGKSQKSKRETNPQPLTPSTQAEVEQEAEECFLKAIDIASRQEAKLWELRATMSLARLWHHQGKQHAAHNRLSEIYGWFTEGFDTKDLQEARTLLEELNH